MSYVLIVSKTRMQNNNVCVGGIDIRNNISLRLMNANGYHESLDECPYKIGQIWDMEYLHLQQRTLPHSEDVSVQNRLFKGILKSGETMLSALKEIGFPIYEGNILNTFEGKLQYTNSGTLYINQESCSTQSTCFWICDHNIVHDDWNEKIRYKYMDGNLRYGYHISFVGLDKEPIHIIPKGTLIRLSLAHWWSPKDSDDEERCYLQLSGYY